MTTKKKGFTLIELMIVVAIIGILAAIAIPNFVKFQAKGKQSEANAQLKAIFSAQKANFPINQGHHLLPQAEATLNMLHAWPDNMAISAYHGIHRRPYDFLSHPMAPCGTLLVAHDPSGAKWDNHGRIGFYLGPALAHYRAYHCFIADTNATRICDSVMFYPAPLVLPGASRFDQLLHLTERLVTDAESKPPAPHDQPLYAECLQKLKEFLIADAPNAPEPTPAHNAATLCPSPPLPVTARAPISAST